MEPMIRERTAQERFEALTHSEFCQALQSTIAERIEVRVDGIHIATLTNGAVVEFKFISFTPPTPTA